MHHLGRIGAWEHLEFNRTLRETLAAVPLRSLAEVFEAAHFAARFRVGEVGNPAGWWVETLRPTVKECLEAVAEDSAHIQKKGKRLEALLFAGSQPHTNPNITPEHQLGRSEKV